MEIIDVTLNPNDMGSGFTLSNGNLTATISTTARGIRATHGKISGKWYWEVKLDSGSPHVYVGVSNKSFPVTTANLTNTNWRAYVGANGNKYPENSQYAIASSAGDIISIALDLDNGTLEFYKNGVSMGVSHTNVKELGEVYPTMVLWQSVATTVTFNFGATTFSHEIPRGFYSYDSRQYGAYNKFLILSNNEYYSIISKVNGIPSKLLKLSNSEENFINYGMNKDTSIDLTNSKISDRGYVVKDSETLGSGKVFKQKIDTSKIPIKNVIIT